MAPYKLSRPELKAIPSPGIPSRQDLGDDEEVVFTTLMHPALDDPRWLAIFRQQDRPPDVVNLELDEGIGVLTVTVLKGRLAEAWEALNAMVSETSQLFDERWGSEGERVRHEAKELEAADARRREEARRLLEGLG